MSDLKHLNKEQLEKAKVDTEIYISHIKGKIKLHEKRLFMATSRLYGQQVRLDWIKKYLERKLNESK
jgi:hypothetical protein